MVDEYDPNDEILSDDDTAEAMSFHQKAMDYNDKAGAPTSWLMKAGAPLAGINRNIWGHRGLGYGGLFVAAHVSESLGKIPIHDTFLDSLGLGDYSNAQKDKTASEFAERGLSPSDLLKGTAEWLAQGVENTPRDFGLGARIAREVGSFVESGFEFAAAGGEKVLAQGPGIVERMGQQIVEGAEKLVGNKLVSQKVAEAVVGIGLNAGKGAGFVAVEKVREKVVNMIADNPLEDPVDTAADVFWGAIWGAGIHAGVEAVQLGGLKLAKNGITYILDTVKGSPKIKIFDKNDMANVGHHAGNGWISAGYTNVSALIKNQWDNVRARLRKNPLEKALVELHQSNLTKSIEQKTFERNLIYQDLKKFSIKDWESLPAAVFKRFERHIEDMKHADNDGATDYEWWSTYIKKNLAGLKLPTHQEWGALSKYHKTKQIALGEESKVQHARVHEPLLTHEAEREAIKKSKESTFYKKKMSQKNKELLDRRAEQLEGHNEEHPLTQKLNEMHALSEEIEESNHNTRTANNLINPEEPGPTQELNEADTKAALANEPPDNVERTGEAKFEDATPLDEKATEKVDLEEIETSKLDELPEELKEEADVMLKFIKQQESSHPKIKAFVEETISCVTKGVK